MRTMTKSKTTTFYKWLKETAIEIPMLQRDYAQGRDDSKTKELRKNFVVNLCNSAETQETTHLDFIYGPKKGGVFQPLDGQQRLTTLFLLHWFIATKAGQLEDAKKWLGNFRYKVRVTTQEFVDAILNPENMNDKILSKENLTDAKWYFSSWDYDPSIQGMLNMIDTINDELKEKTCSDKISALWENLTSNACPITFTVLQMEKFGLGDELYMRMNARGLPLTDFENFKAWLTDHCEGNAFAQSDYFYKKANGTPEETQAKREKSWPYKLDTYWTELIWKPLPSKEKENGSMFDETFMRLFNGFAACGCAKEIKENSQAESDKKTSPAEHESVIKDIIIENPILTNRYPESAFSEESLIRLFRYIDLICKEDWFTKFTVGFEGKELYSFKKLLQKQGGEERRKTLIITYAIICFKENLPDQFSEESQLLKRWVRVIRNLVENTTINSDTLFINAIQAVDTLLDQAQKNDGDILCAIKDSNGDNPFKLNTFTVPFKEEQVKARLIFENNADWGNAIEKAENHPMLRGQITFLLNKSNDKDEFPQLASSEFECFKENFELFLKYWGTKVADKDNHDESKRNLLMRVLLTHFETPPKKINLYHTKNDFSWRTLLNQEDVQRAVCSFFYQIKNVDTQLTEETMLTFLRKVESYKDYNSRHIGFCWDALQKIIKNKDHLESHPLIDNWYESGAILLHNRKGGNSYRCIFPDRNCFLKKLHEKLKVSFTESNLSILDKKNLYNRWGKIDILVKEGSPKIRIEKDTFGNTAYVGLRKNGDANPNEKMLKACEKHGFEQKHNNWICLKPVKWKTAKENPDSILKEVEMLERIIHQTGDS